MYDRFTTKEKQRIVAVISLAGFIGPFSARSFIPCIPAIAKDLQTSGTVVNYSVGAYVFVLAIGNLFWAPYAEYYGRRPVYFMCLPLVCVGSLVSATTKSLVQLIIGRCIQAFGASCVLAIGSATISDIYRLEERGTAMGTFFSIILLGPPLAPLAGGFLTTYISWRATQLCVFLLGLAAFVSASSFLPETSHPGSRGIDVQLAAEELELQSDVSTKALSWIRPSLWIQLNPLGPLALARSPVILFVASAGAFALTTFYTLAVPLSYTLGHFGITTPVLVGACFIPSGIGNIIGANLAGRLADRAIIEGRARRQGKWVPEDRLTTAIPAALILLPASLLIFAYATTYIPGNFGLGIVLLCLFVHGMAVDMVLSPAVTYLVDILQAQRADVVAFYGAYKGAMGAIASAGVLPSINRFGLIATHSMAAMLAWVAFLLLYITIRNGAELRRWQDIGFTPSPSGF